VLINELKLLLGLASNSLEVDLTQCCCLHWSWYSLYAGSYPDAHWPRDISTLPTIATTINCHNLSDCGSQRCVFGFLDAVVVFVCTGTVKPMLQTVVHKTVQMPQKHHLLRKPRHAVAFDRFGTVFDANDCDNPLRTH